MNTFIEVNNNLEICIINLSTVYKVIPVINGIGCVFHFDNGKTQSSTDSFDMIKSRLLKSDTVKVPSKEVVNSDVAVIESPKKKS